MSAAVKGESGCVCQRSISSKRLKGQWKRGVAVERKETVANGWDESMHVEAYEGGRRGLEMQCVVGSGSVCANEWSEELASSPVWRGRAGRLSLDGRTGGRESFGRKHRRGGLDGAKGKKVRRARS